MREPAVPSTFLAELPEALIQADIPRSGGAALRRDQRMERLTRIDREIPSVSGGINKSNGHRWAVGDRLHHDVFGDGKVTHLFGSGEKISIAVKFSGMGPKILDPRLAPIKLTS
jgi:DNA helicase-2/ATP-dependent DNA helicase PcrA